MGDDSAADDAPDGSESSVAYGRPDWRTERTLADPDAVTVGDTITFSKHLREADVRRFADASGDTNRLHLDESFAARGRFGEPIVHGVLVAGLVSAALARLPGAVVYLSQDLRFLAPVAVGSRATATCRVVESLGGDRYRLTTTVTDEDGTDAVDGEATVLVDDPP